MLGPVVLEPNQPWRFYRGGAGIAAFRGLPVLGDHFPEDWVGSTTELFGDRGGGLTARIRPRRPLPAARPERGMSDRTAIVCLCETLVDLICPDAARGRRGFAG